MKKYRNAILITCSIMWLFYFFLRTEKSLKHHAELESISKNNIEFNVEYKIIDNVVVYQNNIEIGMALKLQDSQNNQYFINTAFIRFLMDEDVANKILSKNGIIDNYYIIFNYNKESNELIGYIHKK